MAEKILIVDDDVDTLRLVGLMLQRQGFQISAATNGAQGLAKAFEEKPDLILLDVMMPDMDGYEVTRRLRKNPSTTGIPILMFTAKSQLDDKVTGFEVGADDYLTKPTHPSELQAHIRALLARSGSKDDSSTTAATAIHEQRGHIIGVLAVRGGLGVSSLACNLAAALFTRSQANVILAEMVPGHGTLAMDLGVEHQKALNDMLSGTTVEITSEKVQGALFPHSSGVKLLLASENPGDAHLVSQVNNYEALLARLSTLARFIVLDLGTGLMPFAKKLLTLCNERVVVLEGLNNSITQTRMLIDEIALLGIDRKAITAVLNNRVRSESQMPWNQVQDKLGHTIATTITPAPELFIQATRTQSIPVIVQPTNVSSQQYLKLADTIIEREKAR